MQGLTLIRGIPGSGKSTLAKQLAGSGKTTVHLEVDMFFYDAHGNYNFDSKKLWEAHKWCQDMCVIMLERHRYVVVTNTFTTLDELKPYFDIAKRFKIVPNIITCQNQFKDIHNVPLEKLTEMREKFVWDVSSLFEQLTKTQ